MSSTYAKHRTCRKFGIPLCGSQHCPALKRPFAPGQHGRKTTFHRAGAYGVQQAEKQKLKFIYGVKERQFHRYYKEAIRNKQERTGDALLQRLETRLDNVIYRLGYARSISQARQLVVHRHITVNNQTVDRPSYRVGVGRTVGLTDHAKTLPSIIQNLNEPHRIPPYLAYDASAQSGMLVAAPHRSEIPVAVDTDLIVEYYARS